MSKINANSLSNIKSLAKKLILISLLSSLILGGIQFLSFNNKTIKANADPATNLDVTINQSPTQPDPASNSMVKFTAIFSEPIDVASFDVTDVSLSGTATDKVVDSITQIAPNDGTTFEIAVSSTGPGTIIADIPVSQFNGYTSSTFANVGLEPHGIAIDGYDNIYTANYSSGTITKITPAGTTSVFGTPGSPLGIAIDAGGNAYTANRGAYEINKTTPAGITSTIANQFTNSFNVAVDSLGNVFGVSPNVFGVRKITPSGVVTTINTGYTAQDVTVGSDNSIYTANTISKTVSKITASGFTTTYSIAGGSPQSVTVDGNNNIFTSNFPGNNVSKITASGIISTLGTTNSYPFGVTTDQFSNVYTANYDSNNVSKITPAGVSTIIGTTGNNPRDIVLDSSGNVYTTNTSSNNVTKLTKTLTAGVKTLSNKGNQISTSTDNVVTFGLLPSLGTQTGIANGIIGQPFPYIPLNGNNIEDNTPASFTFDDTAITIQGIIKNNNFIPNFNQLATANTPLGNSTGTLTVANTPTLAIATNFAPALTFPGLDLLNVNIEQNVNQPDPSNILEANFTATFSQPIDATSFDISDVSLNGTAPDKVISSITEVSPNNGTAFEIKVVTTGFGTVIVNIDKSNIDYAGAYFATTDNVPYDIINDGSDNFYVSNSDYGNNITKILSDGTSFIYGETGTYPEGLAIDSQGNLFVANQGDNAITKLDLSGIMTFVDQSSGIRQLVVDKLDNIFGANDVGEVLKYFSDGTKSLISSGLRATGGVVLDNQNNIYYLNQENNSITKLTPDGISTIFANTGNGPEGIAIDRTGNIFTSNIYSNDITKVTPNGISTIFANVGLQPRRIITDPQGNVYTTNYIDSTLTKVLPDGTTINLGNTENQPIGIALDSKGNVYIVNSNSNNVSKFTKTITSGINTLSNNGNLASTSNDNVVTLNYSNPTIIAPALVNQNNVSNFAATGTCNPGIDVNVVFTMLFSIDTIAAQCLANGTFSTASTLITNGCYFSDTAACPYTVVANQNIDGSDLYSNYQNGTVDIATYGEILIPKVVDVAGTSTYIFDNQVQIYYYCTDNQTFNFTTNYGGNYNVNCLSSANSVNISQYFPTPLPNGILTINGNIIDENGNTNSVFYEKEVCYDPNFIPTPIGRSGYYSDTPPNCSPIQSSSTAASSVQSTSGSLEIEQSSIQSTSSISISSSMVDQAISSAVSSTISSESCVIIVPLVPSCPNSISSSSQSPSSQILDSSSQSSSNSVDIVSSSSILQTSSLLASSSIENSSSSLVNAQSSSISSVLPDNDGDNVPSDIEELAPNNGDGNNDGVKDSSQPNVASILDTVTNKIVTIDISNVVISSSITNTPSSIATQINSSAISSLSASSVQPISSITQSSSSILTSSLLSSISSISSANSSLSQDPAPACQQLTDVSIIKEEDIEFKDSGYYYPAGFVNFRSTCATSLNVKIYWYGLDTTKNYVNRKYKASGQSYEVANGINSYIQSINGSQVFTYNYSVEDNGPLDEDPTIGTILDPIGPALTDNSQNGGGLITIANSNTINSVTQYSISSNIFGYNIQVQNDVDQSNSSNKDKIIDNTIVTNTANTIRTGGDGIGLMIIILTITFILILSGISNQQDN
jgi:streptogramin lyase